MKAIDSHLQKFVNAVASIIVKLSQKKKSPKRAKRFQVKRVQIKKRA